MPTGSPADRTGLTICDATSAAFAQRIDWAKIDVGTFSWQKALGGEGGHGMLVLSPRAVERLEQAQTGRPLPKIFRLTKGGALIEGVFKGETINTPSMLAVEDWLVALDWAERIGGLDALVARADANAAALDRWVAQSDWIEHLAGDPAIRSNTSVCLQFADRSDEEANTARQKAIVKLLEAEDAALRHWRLPRRTSRPSHLVRSNGGHCRHREARAVARLGLGGDGVSEQVRVLISDKMDPRAAAIFRERGIVVDEKPGLTPEEFAADHRRL